jgi:type VI secretion system FHA domain protein
VTLTLEVTASSGGKSGDLARQVFDEEGGTIGRAGSNTWVLMHNKVSGKHALISFRQGVFYIQDVSRNGVCVNSRDNRLVRNRPYALKSGDRIVIEPYEIDVRIDDADRAARQAFVDSFGEDDPFAQPLESRPGSPGPDPSSQAMDSGEVDPLKFFDPVATPARARRSQPVAPVDDLLGEHYEPPALHPRPAPAESGQPVIPQGYNPLAPDDSGTGLLPTPRPGPARDPVQFRPRRRDIAPPELPPLPTPGPPARSSPEALDTPAPRRDVARHQQPDGHDLASVLTGAGLHGAAVTPELARSFGQILRVVVSGLMDVLQARQRIKEEFRMHQTLFRPSDNNPLKFSANVDDALHNLLVKRNAAYLGPVEAFADAFEDLRNHQLAMLAGIRIAFQAMLAESDPDRLQDQFDRQLSSVSLPLVPAKLRYWDLYRERRRELVKDPEAAFARLFGEEFARAYEEQFRQLKAQGRKRAGGQPTDTRAPRK